VGVVGLELRRLSNTRSMRLCRYDEFVNPKDRDSQGPLREPPLHPLTDFWSSR
jgi:hypothetical protein